MGRGPTITMRPADNLESYGGRRKPTARTTPQPNEQCNLFQRSARTVHTHNAEKTSLAFRQIYIDYALRIPLRKGHATVSRLVNPCAMVAAGDAAVCRSEASSIYKHFHTIHTYICIQIPFFHYTNAHECKMRVSQAWNTPGVEHAMRQFTISEHNSYRVAL